MSTAIPVGGHGEGERVDGVVGEGGGGEDDDVEVVEDDDRDDKEGGDGDEEDWVGGCPPCRGLEMSITEGSRVSHVTRPSVPDIRTTSRNLKHGTAHIPRSLIFSLY